MALLDEADQRSEIFVAERGQGFGRADRVSQRKGRQVFVAVAKHRIVEFGAAIINSVADAKAVAEAHDRRIEYALARLAAIAHQRQQRAASVALQLGQAVDGGDAHAEDMRRACHVDVLLLGEERNKFSRRVGFNRDQA